MWWFPSQYHITCRNSQLACSLLKEKSCSAIWKSLECENQRPIMPKPTKSSVQGAAATPPPKESTQSSQEEPSSSDQEHDPEITFQPPRQPQPIPGMFMLYIEGPKMDWTFNDGLYHSFLKWHLKCENILECELAALPEFQQCKKVIAWSGDFGMDQYVSWGLPSDQVTLDTIWGKFEKFCKPHWNEVCTWFDLLASFRQGNHSIDEWHNVVQAQVNLAKYPPETAKILHRDIFWFFLCDEEFASRTISDGNVDLQSSKATSHHIKQVAGDPQALQINLLRHQCTELPSSKYKKKKSQSNHKWHVGENYQVQTHHKKRFDPKSAHNNKDRCSKCRDTAYIEGFQCPAKKYQCKACHKFGHFTSICFQKKQATSKPRRPKTHQLQAGTTYVKESALYDHLEEDSTS